MKSVQGQGQFYFLSSPKIPCLNEDPVFGHSGLSLVDQLFLASCKNKVCSVIFMQLTSAHQYSHLHWQYIVLL